MSKGDRRCFLLVSYINLIYFRMIKYSLGIDISSMENHACISSIDLNQTVKVIATSKFANSAAGFKALISWIEKYWKEKNIPFVVIMEATGVYYEECALHLFKAGYHVSVVLPNKAKKYLQSTGIKSKNDKIDSKGLSRMAAEQCLEKWQPLSPFFFNLRSLTRHLQSLQEMKTSISNQLHASRLSMYQNKDVLKQHKELIRKVDKQIADMEQAIEDHINSDKEIAEKARKMVTIKGVGLLTVAVILAETNGFALFENGKQLVSFAGYDVIENQSGKHVGKTRISKRGNHRIRRILFMPAFNVVRYNVDRFIQLYERTYEKHHIKMKSYVAVQKKLLVALYTLWNKNEEFKMINIQEQEQVLSSLLGFKKAVKKSSHAFGVTTQGKHPVNDHSIASSLLMQK
jgi:transposase